MRVDYRQGTLDETTAGDDPFALFARWFDDAVSAGIAEPNAMTLATCDPTGRPSARIVLLKAHGPEGFTFFTNYESRKATDLEASGWAALVFFWQPLERQVRIEGAVTRVSPAESDAYFEQRPLGARLGAWASQQSRPVPDRAALETRLAEVTARFGAHPPRPPHWGGYRVRPTAFEFWQGRPDRLHDRIVFVGSADTGWTRNRLSP
jgi:pyridoxamine 5'-phosphate oxidase